jgi:hypothetical protein
MKRPEEGGAPTSPDILVLRSETSEGLQYLKIPNWNKPAPSGQFNLCVSLTAAAEGTTLINKPRLEAYDTFEAAFTGEEPESPLLLGTTNTGNKPLLRAIDLTAEAMGFVSSSSWPPSGWWVSPLLTEGGSDGSRIKYLKGDSSYLEPATVIVPKEGYTSIDGITYDANSEKISSEFYFSICPVIPDDITRGQTKKDIVIVMRTFFA